MSNIIPKELPLNKYKNNENDNEKLEINENEEEANYHKIIDHDKETYLEITHKPLNNLTIEESMRRESTGASVTFLGTTRNNFENKIVIQLAYECYLPMAMNEMIKIVEECRVKWPEISGIGVVHRIGEVKVKEISIVVVVSSPHRPDAFNAAQYLVDHVKKTVPIWKNEMYDDGTSLWKESCPHCH